MPRKASINYLFPPDQINELPSWRFVLHFQAPRLFAQRALQKAVAELGRQDWKAVEFERPLALLAIDSRTHTVGVAVEVPEARRRQPGSLEDYESDVWKIWGHLMSHGFGDLFYEAVDFHDEGWEA